MIEILSLHGLSPDQQAQLSGLYDRCLPEEKIHLRPSMEIRSKLFPDLSPHHLAFQDNLLVGYLGLVSELDLEARIFVDPSFRRMGVGRSLTNNWTAQGKSINGLDWLTTCADRSESGKAFLKAQGGQFLHSEFLLEWKKTMPIPSSQDKSMRLVPINDQNVMLFSELVATIFNSNPQDLCLRFRYEIADQGYQLFLLQDETGAIGTARALLSLNEVLLTTVGIIPNMQGKGAGQHLMLNLLDLLSSQSKPIRIEVEIDHQPALKLYQKCGFELCGQFAYYRLAFSGQPDR